MSITSLIVKKKNLSDMVVSRIQDHIITNSMKVGDRLPTEQEMATQFGVSRISIREATKALNFLGLIESAPRRGLTIGSIDMDRLTNILSFQFSLDNYPKELLLKTRMVIEIGSLQYAMESIKSDLDIYKKLMDMCSKLEQTTDIDAYIKLDADIHSTLVRISGIEPLVAFNDVLQVFFARFRQSVLNQRENWAIAANSHRLIIDALKKGKLNVAEDLLRMHLEVHKDVI